MRENGESWRASVEIIHKAPRLAAPNRVSAGDVDHLNWSLHAKPANPGVLPIKVLCLLREARTSSYEDKKPPILNNNEDQQLSLLLGGRKRFPGPGCSLSFWGKLLT